MFPAFTNPKATFAPQASNAAEDEDEEYEYEEVDEEVDVEEEMEEVDEEIIVEVMEVLVAPLSAPSKEPPPVPAKPKKSLEQILAEAEEEFDLKETPIDAAVKVLRTGKDVQKLSTIRNLLQLLDSDDRDEAIWRVLPAIQEALAQESTNSLDLHCEAAVVYKKIIKDKRVEKAGLKDFSELHAKLLNYSLENVEKQDENVTAAAWLESLIDIADCIPQQSVVERLVPLVMSQSALHRRVQRRVIAARLLEKLAGIVPSDVVRRSLALAAKKLSDDPSPTVRSTMAQRLGSIAQALKSPADCVSLLLPCFTALCKDDDPSVRESILTAIALSLPYFTAESRRGTVLPLLRRCTDQALIMRDASLSVVAKQLGSWLESLKAVLGESELKWFLQTYCRLVEASSTTAVDKDPTVSAEAPITITVNEGGGTKMARGSPKPGATSNTAETANSAIWCQIRRQCAYNFPCFAMVYAKDHFHKCLLPILERFCKDSDDEVRCSIASGFHEIIQLRAGEEQYLLLGPFMELMASGSSEVIQRIAINLHRSLPPLYKGIPSISTSMASSRARLDKLVLSCNRLLKGNGAWRSHEAYLKNIAVVKSFVTVTELQTHYQPMLQEEVLTVRALPCRVAAAQSLLLMMREYPTQRSRGTVIDFFTAIIARHISCHRRRLLLDIVPIVLKNFSREFFIREFLPTVLPMATDKISNIRLQLCRLLPIIKHYLFSPNDDDVISRLESRAREMISSERNENTSLLLLQCQSELAQTPTCDPKELKNNRAKLAEERRLWTETEPVVEIRVVEATSTESDAKNQEPRRLTLRRSATANEVSTLSVQGRNLAESVKEPERPLGSRAWRTTRPTRLAVVRPQPQITVVAQQRASSPRPPDIEPVSQERDLSHYGVDEQAGSSFAKAKSRLPLATGRLRSASMVSTTSGSALSAHPAPSFTSGPTSPAKRIEAALKKYRPKRAEYGPTASSSHSPASTHPSPPIPPMKSMQAREKFSQLRRSESAAGLTSTSGHLTPSSSASSVVSTTSSRSSTSSSRRPYSLMKVQSTSAVERKPSQMSIKPSSRSARGTAAATGTSSTMSSTSPSTLSSAPSLLQPFWPTTSRRVQERIDSLFLKRSILRDNAERGGETRSKYSLKLSSSLYNMKL